MKLELTWCVEYGDADVSVLLDVWVPDLIDHLELWGSERVLFGKVEVALEEATLVKGVRRTHYHHLPLEDVLLVR